MARSSRSAHQIARKAGQAAEGGNRKIEGASGGRAAAGIRLDDWEILVDDDGEGYLSAYKEPYGLYVRQIDGACFFWHVITDRDDDIVDVAEGKTPTVVAAMAAAEAAARGLGKKVAKRR
jgi:hypothetical protein